MLSLTKLITGQSYSGDRLRYAHDARLHDHGTSPGSGPVVVWNATKTCNLECVHCYADAQKRKFSGELTTEEAIAMIDDLAAFNVPALLMSGGEPLVRPDILDLARYARARGIRVTFSTNGTLINGHVARALAEMGVAYVGISIDGSEAIHDRFRGREGAYSDALRGIRNARNAGIRVGLRFTLTKDNWHDMNSVLALAEQEGVGRVCIYHLVYSGRGSYMENSDLTQQEKREATTRLFERVRTWAEEGREIELLTVDNHADGPFLYFWLLENMPERADEALALMRKNGGNRSGMAIACIDSFGFVHPDQFTLNHTLGSIREMPFSRIWAGGKHYLADLRSRQDRLLGRCRECVWLPSCNGNFRARAEAASGDPWGMDPACYLTDAETRVAVPAP